MNGRWRRSNQRTLRSQRISIENAPSPRSSVTLSRRSNKASAMEASYAIRVKCTCHGTTASRNAAKSACAWLDFYFQLRAAPTDTSGRLREPPRSPLAVVQTKATNQNCNHRHGEPFVSRQFPVTKWFNVNRPWSAMLISSVFNNEVSRVTNRCLISIETNRNSAELIQAKCCSNIRIPISSHLFFMVWISQIGVHRIQTSTCFSSVDCCSSPASTVNKGEAAKIP